MNKYIMFGAVMAAAMAAEAKVRTFCPIPEEREVAAGERLEIPLPDLAAAGCPNQPVVTFEICQSEKPTGARKAMGCVCVRDKTQGSMEGAKIPCESLAEDGSWKKVQAVLGYNPKGAIRVITPAKGYGGKWKVRNFVFTDYDLHLSDGLKSQFNCGYLAWAGKDAKKHNGEWIGGGWATLSGVPFAPVTWNGKKVSADPDLFVYVNKPTKQDLADAAGELVADDDLGSDDDGMGDMLADDDAPVVAKKEKGPKTVAVKVPAGEATYGWLYVQSSLVDGTPKFAMKVRFKDAAGKTAEVPLKWGVDVRDWRDLEPKRNSFNEYVYPINGDKSEYAAVSAMRIAVPESLGPLREVAFVAGSPHTEGAFMLHDLILSNYEYAFNERPTYTTDKGPGWKQVLYTNKRDGIKKGSPLDRSPKVRKTTDELGRLVSDGKGGLYCENDPTKTPVRFITGAGPNWYSSFAGVDAWNFHDRMREQVKQGKRKSWDATSIYSPDWAIEDGVKVEELVSKGYDKRNRPAIHQRIEVFTENYLRAGYRIVDLYEDGCWGFISAKGGLDFEPELEDILFYLVKCMEDRGMYLTWNIGGGLFRKGNPFAMSDAEKKNCSHSFWDCEDPEDLKARKDMEQGVRQLLTKKNPYTGRALVDSPVLAYILCWNERYFYKWGHFPHDIFRRDILKKYNGDVEQVKAAWNGPGNCYRKRGCGWNDAWDGDDLKKVDFGLGMPWMSEDSQRGDDLAEIVDHRQRETFQWFKNFLVSIGVKCPISDTNLGRDGLHLAARADGGFTTANEYHSHPQPNLGAYPSKWHDQRPDIGCRGELLRYCLAGRLRNKPTMVTEGDITFYSYSRYEQAYSLTMLGALNGYSWIKSFSQGALGSYRATPEAETWGPMAGFSGGNDPVKWATEFLSWHAMEGRSVKESEIAFRADLDSEKALHHGYGGRAACDWATSLGLVGKFWVDVVPEGGTPKPAAANEIVVPYAGMKPEEVQKIIDDLKAKGALAKDNRTNVWLDRWESSTGELFTDAANDYATVNAPRLQGMFAQAGGKCALRDMKITDFTEAGCLCAATLDDKPLAESKDIMLVYATDAMNCKMLFPTTKREKTYRNGVGPTIVKTGRFVCEIANANAKDFKLEALCPDGTVWKDLSDALRVEGGKLVVALDTEDLDRITPFYHLSVK